MPDYYDYAPRVHLDKPVVLVGYLTEFTRALAYRAAALLGLPYHDIERLIEHEAGKAIARIVLEEGEDGYRRVESICLRRVLGQKPPGLVALGDGGLMDDDNLAEVRRQSRLVVFDFDLANLYWRAQRLSRRGDRDDWHVLFEGSPDSIDALRPFYLERRAGYDQADLRIDANGLETPAACELMMKWLVREP
jgi:shikimate kinase